MAWFYLELKVKLINGALTNLTILVRDERVKLVLNSPRTYSVEIQIMKISKNKCIRTVNCSGCDVIDCAGTDNDLASREGGYENISVLYPPSSPTVEFLECLTTQIKPGDASADCILNCS